MKHIFIIKQINAYLLELRFLKNSVSMARYSHYNIGLGDLTMNGLRGLNSCSNTPVFFIISKKTIPNLFSYSKNCHFLFNINGCEQKRAFVLKMEWTNSLIATAKIYKMFHFFLSKYSLST